MKKILLIALFLFCFVTTAFASATLSQTIKVNPDTLINGESVGSFSGDTITLNKTYLTAVGAFQGDQVTVRFVLGGFTGRLCPNLIPSEYGKFGKVAYNTINNTYKSWARDNSSGATPITVLSDSVIINAKYLSKVTRYETVSIKSSQSACGTSGLYPNWKFTIDVKLSQSEFNAVSEDLGVLAVDVLTQ